MKSIEMIWKMLPTNEQALGQLEERLGFRLPQDYRDFLLRYNGGGPDERNYCSQVTGDNDPYLITLFFPVEGRVDLFSQWKTYKGRIPASLLPIGSDDLGNLFCLGVDGPARNRVYFWDHEGEKAAFDLVGEVAPGDIRGRRLGAENDSGYWRNILLVANSFTDFVNGLGECPAPT